MRRSSGSPDLANLAPAAIDHLVVVVADLDSGAAWLEDKLGVTLAPGGKHAAMGTHNRLLRLGPALYLELIAIDPAAALPHRPRWFGLDDAATRARFAERPRLLHWVARVPDLDAALAACPETLGDILELSRDHLRWRITVPADGLPPLGGLLPALIEWKTDTHPASNLPDAACELMKLEGFHPDAERARRALPALGLENTLAVFSCERNEPAGLAAYLKTPAGLIEID